MHGVPRLIRFGEVRSHRVRTQLASGWRSRRICYPSRSSCAPANFTAPGVPDRKKVALLFVPMRN